MRVVTRFAPSPTGMLHIGGARTALFNYLFAKKFAGRFLLRVEDTDRERSTPEATAAILDAMDWLGLTPDEPPVMQSAQAQRHAEVANDMVARGTAFRCYVTSEELQARRDEGEAKRLAAREEGLTDDAKAELQAEAGALLAPFRSPWRDGGAPPSSDAPFTVRLRAPDGDERAIDDGVQGIVKVHASEIDDLVLLRTDGTPTYMLAVVVDDHDMEVTHVIRGDDHLRNTFRQVPIYEAIDWPVPQFAHLPMIHGNDGAKLSKRHGALSTTVYRDLGYLPEGLKAYLLRLGWSHGDQEIFTEDEAASLFDLGAINKAPARLDLEKLGTVNAHFIREADNARLFDLLEPFLKAEGPLEDDAVERIRRALPHMKDRGTTLVELASAFKFLRASRPVELSKNAKKALTSDNVVRIRPFVSELRSLAVWSTASISDAITSYCAATGLSMGQIGPPLRAALTGGLPAPDLAPVMDWLGREETLGRIEDQMDAAAGTSAADN